jgi:DUF4097 and DUF4098 domain-containing protein YvlB
MRLHLLIAVLAVATAAHADTWNKTYNVSGAPTVYVKAGDGNLHVRSADTKQVRIVVTTEGYRLGNDEVTVDESQSGDSIRVELRVPHRHFSIGWSNRRIDIDLTVPKQAALDLNTTDGNIDAAWVAGDLRFHSGDGNLELHNLDGSLLANTGDGHIRADGRFDRVDLRSGDGRVELEAQSGSRTTMGWHLKSGDGRISVRLPQDFAADLDASTGDGSIDIEFPLTMEGGMKHNNRVYGKINGGGGMLDVHSGDGSIRIERL